MAARDDEPRPDDTEGTGAEGTATAESGKARRAGALLVPDALVRISIGIIILGGMTVGAFFLITDVIAPNLGQAPTEDVSGTATDDAVAPPVEPPGQQWVVADIIVNPAGTRGKRFLRLGIAMETKDGSKVIAELDSRRAQMRDLLIRKFSARTLDELSDPTVREETRLSCIEEINANLSAGQISELYFTDYVLQ